MCQLIQEYYSDLIEKFRSSSQWVARFWCRSKVALRQKTHSTKNASRSRNYSSQIPQILRVWKRGKYELADIANIDQMVKHMKEVILKMSGKSHEGVMVIWIKNDWSSYFINPATPSSDGKLLIADIHWGQQTPKVKNYLRCKTQLVNIPGGLTGYVQVVNKPLQSVCPEVIWKAYGRESWGLCW